MAFALEVTLIKKIILQKLKFILNNLTAYIKYQSMFATNSKVLPSADTTQPLGESTSASYRNNL